jgi:hypothetical protein
MTLELLSDKNPVVGRHCNEGKTSTKKYGKTGEKLKEN